MPGFFLPDKVKESDRPLFFAFLLKEEDGAETKAGKILQLFLI